MDNYLKDKVDPLLNDFLDDAAKDQPEDFVG